MKIIIILNLILGTIVYGVDSSPKKNAPSNPSCSQLKEERMYKTVLLINSFIKKLQDNTVFIREDEKKYFHPIGAGFTLAEQLGYVDQSDNILEPQIFSHIGELIRLNKSSLVYDATTNYKIYLSTYSFFHIHQAKEIPLENKINTDTSIIHATIEWYDGLGNTLKNTKNLTVTMLVFCPSDDALPIISIDSIRANGIPLLKILGFELKKRIAGTYGGKAKEKLLPYLPKEELEKLKVHIKKLVKEQPIHIIE